MTNRILSTLALAVLTVLAACGNPPAPIETTTASTPPVARTPVAVPTTVAAAVATPAGRAITTTLALPTPSPIPTPPTPAATPTLAPSAALLREAAALQSTLEEFRVALESGDREALLEAQRALLGALPEAEAAAAQDRSKAAEGFRRGIQDLRAALSGDLAKLEGAAKDIGSLLSEVPSARQPARTVSPTTAQGITSVPRFAKELAEQLAAFEQNQAEGSVGELLRLQKTLLDQLERGEAALRSAKGKDADTVRGALEDLRNALNGDGVKFATALAKLRQVGQSAGQASGTANSTAARQVDLQPVANELRNKLEALRQAAEKNDRTEIANAQRALADQVKAAEAALSSTASPRAGQLREAIGAAREAAGGDLAKIDTAKGAVEGFLASLQ